MTDRLEVLEQDERKKEGYKEVQKQIEMAWRNMDITKLKEEQETLEKGLEGEEADGDEFDEEAED